LAFDSSKLKFGDMIAAGSAAILFISLFLNYYKVEVKGFGQTLSDGISAWDAFSVGDLFLLLVVIVVIAVVVIRATGATVSVPVPLSQVVLVAGGLATLYILYRIINSPAPSGLPDGIDVKRSIGIFLGFLAAIGITAGGFLSARERGDAIPGVGGAGFGGGAGSPLGGGQPGGGYQGGGYQQQATPAAQPATAAQPAAAQPAAASSPKADWYPDPQGQARLRYWDGTQWTDQTAD
jgi:hypothetical protein